MRRALSVLLVACILECLIGVSYCDSNRVLCYDQYGQAQRCLPPFVNAAFNLSVEATNTCGMRGPEEFYQQTGISGATKSRDFCDNSRHEQAHPPDYLTDFHSVDHLSWWQSSTMMEDVQWPNSVNLSLHLGKTISQFMGKGKGRVAEGRDGSTMWKRETKGVDVPKYPHVAKTGPIFPHGAHLGSIFPHVAHLVVIFSHAPLWVRG